jgi:hypothetical protein
MEAPKDFPADAERDRPLPTRLQRLKYLKAEFIVRLREIGEAADDIAASIAEIERSWTASPDAADLERICQDAVDISRDLVEIKLLWDDLPSWLAAGCPDPDEIGTHDKEAGGAAQQFAALRDAWRFVPSCESREDFNSGVALAERVREEMKKQKGKGAAL